MSYLSQAQDPRSRVTGIAFTAAVNGVIGAALVAGLTVSIVAPPIEIRNPIPLSQDPPPKPPPPEPKQQQQQPLESKFTAPLPPLDLHPLDPVGPAIADPAFGNEGFGTGPGPIADPVADPIRPAFTPRGARPSNSPQGWLSNADYPDGTEAEGVAGYHLIVGTNGRVSACDVTRSTGNRQLDAATCRFIRNRARFEAATDDTGAKVVGSFTGTVRWEIPD